MSTYLPNWYNNDDNESCEEYYQDVRYMCACPQVTTPPATCGKLCQDRRICEPICSDGSEVPNLDLVVRRETCQGWRLCPRPDDPKVRSHRGPRSECCRCCDRPIPIGRARDNPCGSGARLADAARHSQSRHPCGSGRTGTEAEGLRPHLCSEVSSRRMFGRKPSENQCC